jgi:hypothetical protein
MHNLRLHKIYRNAANIIHTGEHVPYLGIRVVHNPASFLSSSDQGLVPLSRRLLSLDERMIREGSSTHCNAQR